MKMFCIITFHFKQRVIIFQKETALIQVINRSCPQNPGSEQAEE